MLKKLEALDEPGRILDLCCTYEVANLVRSNASSPQRFRLKLKRSKRSMKPGRILDLFAGKVALRGAARAAGYQSEGVHG
jgi:hypothetical protein